MSNPSIGLDIPSLNKSLNELFRATVTRIRRCISVKRVACEKIREDNQEAREYGFKHLRKVIEIQIQSYPRYRNNLNPFSGKVASLKEQINSLASLDDGFIGRFRFNNAKKNLEGSGVKIPARHRGHIKEFGRETCQLARNEINLL